MAIQLQPTASLQNLEEAQYSVFLAGSIDNGKAENWQQELISSFEEENITFLNPRRDDWDSQLEPVIENPAFKEQVLWELEGLEKCDLIAMYFTPSSKAPITLLELGLFARSRKVLICCPKGYWRKGNIDIVAEKWNIEQVESFSDLKDKILQHYKRKMTRSK